MKRISLFTLAIGTFLFFAFPIATIFILAITGDLESLKHLVNTVLTVYIANSLKVVIGTVLLALVFAVPSAWVVARYRFFSQGTLQWLLCLPLAMPAYLTAFLYTDILDYSGPVQSFLREIFGWTTVHDYWFPHIRSLGGACLILALCLYPYIFLMARLALIEQAENLTHSAKLLGASTGEVFWRITLPLIRPALGIGCALVAMETLGDFGTVYFFSVHTLTTAIYDTWLGLGDSHAAAQISLSILGLVVLFIWLERYGRRKQRLYQRGTEAQIPLKPLKGFWPRFWVGYAWTIVVLAFIYPVGQLTYWTVFYFNQSYTSRFTDYLQNSLIISCLAAVFCVAFALLIHAQARFNNHPLARMPLSVGTMGYAVPGTVLALGLLIPMASADNLLLQFTKWAHMPSFGLVFTSTIFCLLVAFVIRFAAMPIGSIDTALGKIPYSLDMASRSMGYGATRTWFKVHMPLLRGGIFTALLFVFVEAMKELNASLLLRPFGFETLVTHVYAYTSDEQLERAALPALILIVAGLIPVIYLTYSMLKTKRVKR